MKVAKEVIEKVKANKNCRNRLAYEMGKHVASIDRWLDENEENGQLTTAKAVEVISEELSIKKVLA